MFKLVAAGGKLRGQEIILTEGGNVIGRSAECDHQLSIDGISKKHMSITVNNDTAFVEDLGSSNGTFVNGKIIKKMTVKNGDTIALPNVIFKIVHVKEKRVVVKKKVAKSETEENANHRKEVAPKDFSGRVKFAFKHKVMSVVYSFNEKYEWNVLLGIFIGLFIVTNLSLTIGPVLSTSKRILVSEIAARGEQYANEVARTNASSLSRGNLKQINTTFLDNADGVQDYELVDLQGRVIRPLSKQNSYTTDWFSVQSKEFFKNVKNINQRFIKARGGDIYIGKAIQSYQVKTGRTEVVGVIAIRFRPKSLEAEAANNSTAYAQSLIITGIVGIVFFGLIYYMTTKHLEDMRYQIEEVLRGNRKELESPYLMQEVYSLRSTINSLLQRLRELQNDGESDIQDIEDDSAYVRTLNEFMQGAQGPVIILNSEKNIEHINSEAEDLTGMRESSSAGTGLLDSARDQGFAATVIDLCDQSANAEGANQSEHYELTGRNYIVHVSSLIGKDNFAKAFYITFVMDE